MINRTQSTGRYLSNGSPSTKRRKMTCGICGRNCHRGIPFQKLTPAQRAIATKTCRYIWWTTRCLRYDCWNRRNPCSPYGMCDKCNRDLGLALNIPVKYNSFLEVQA